MALGPYREDIQFDLFTMRQNGGATEVLAFFKTPINGWYPMIALWHDERLQSPEDTITVMGKTFAFCISDQTTEDFHDRLTPLDPRLVESATMFAIGSLTRRVA